MPGFPLPLPCTTLCCFPCCCHCGEILCWSTLVCVTIAAACPPCCWLSARYKLCCELERLCWTSCWAIALRWLLEADPVVRCCGCWSLRWARWGLTWKKRVKTRKSLLCLTHLGWGRCLQSSRGGKWDCRSACYRGGTWLQLGGGDGQTPQVVLQAGHDVPALYFRVKNWPFRGFPWKPL